MSPVHPDDAAGARTERGWELLDMVRQWSYSRVTRRANLARHAPACRQCRHHAARPDRYRKCSQLIGLERAVAECDHHLGQLRELLAALDRQAEQTAPEPQPTLFA